MTPLFTENSFQNQLQSAAALFLRPALGFDYSPTELAKDRQVARSTIYRQGHTLIHNLQQYSTLQEQYEELKKENIRLQQQVSELQQTNSQEENGKAVFVTAERIALTVLEMAGRKFSTEEIKATLRVAFSPLTPPSDGTINTIIKIGSELAEQLQDVAPNIYPLLALELDELFHAQSPLLMMIEPYSMAIVLLEQLGNARAKTWEFAMEYRGIEAPFLMVHDCSAQGNSLVRILERHSQLCLFHRLREINREMSAYVERAYKKAYNECDERLWDLAVLLEKNIALLAQCTSLLDFKRGVVRRAQQAEQEFYAIHKETLECLEMLEEAAGEGVWKVPSLRSWPVREEKFFNQLKRWDLLADEVVFTQGEKGDGFVLLDALASVHIGAKLLEIAHQEKDIQAYWLQQKEYMQSCKLLRELQAKCENSGFIAKKFELWVEYETRTTSRIEAVNRRLRAFTDAKRNITDRLLRLMQLHHNTTKFTADAKRAGQSPWQLLGIDIPGLKDGFVGVLREANKGRPWPSTWELKAA